MTESKNCDVDGRVYLKLSEAKVWQTVEVDDAFTCFKPGTRVVLLKDQRNGDFYFHCDAGQHFISGNVDDAGEHCLGLYPVR